MALHPFRTGTMQDTYRIKKLEDTYLRVPWYVEVTSGTTGRITFPAGGTLATNQWSGSVSAKSSTITAGEKPTGIAAKTSAGVDITVTISLFGAWALSGTPSAYPIAIIYYYDVKLFNFNREYSLDTVTAPNIHLRQHAITSTSDHTSSATAGQVLKADANGLPVDIGVQTAGTVFAGPTSGAAANPAFRVPIAQDVTVPGGIGSPSYNDLQDYLNTVQSSGRINGMVLTAHSPADGTLDISAGTGIIKTTNALGATTVFFAYTGGTVSLTDNALNYIYLDYNGGTLLVRATTDRTVIHEYDQFTIGRCYREGTDASDITSSGTNIYNEFRRIHNRLVKRYGFAWASGSALSEAGTRGLAVTAGVWYMGHMPSHCLSAMSIDIFNS